LDTLPTLEESEQLFTMEALRRAGGNQGTAAEMLGISRTALNKRIHRRETPP
ncbi:MAG TPA: helix-turn-helix domain-containing protein, partial [Spirochaetia bacterium]|nr:helix-turn-helix domain-containing protein [Spirochaetia bacterium]